MRDFLSEWIASATAFALQFAPASYPAGPPAAQGAAIRPDSHVESVAASARRPLSYMDSLRLLPSTPRNALRFPDGFMWGVAVAGAQVEGHDLHSSWAAWERQGKTREPKGRAVDSWQRYEDDLALAASTGASAFRLSIEWSRVEPRPGSIDWKALARYERIVDTARRLKLEPVVTLYHFSYPTWLDGGQPGPADLLGAAGWERKATPAAYARYVNVVARALKGKVRYWITVNEPNVEPGLGYLIGAFPPGRTHPIAYARAMQHILDAHVAAYDILHRADPEAMVSTNIFRTFLRQGARTSDWLPAIEPGEAILDKLYAWKDAPNAEPRRTLDYIAYDYYYSFSLPEFFQLADYWRWPIYPPGLYDAAVYYYQRYNLPILVAENGMAEYSRTPRQDGWTREAFLVNHTYELQRAVADGVPVLGYFYWSLMDNYEWGSYAPTFGLYRVDRGDPTLARLSTPAAEVYRRLATTNGVPADLLDRYLYRKS